MERQKDKHTYKRRTGRNSERQRDR